MMTSQILKFVDFTKTQKSRYLENKKYFYGKKDFCSGGNLQYAFCTSR